MPWRHGGMLLERRKRPKELEKEKGLCVKTNKVCWRGGLVSRVVRVVEDPVLQVS